MPETVIDLGLVEAWEPPEPPARAWHPRRWSAPRRLLAVVAIALLACGLLTAAGPAPAAGPLWRIEHQVMSVHAAAGRVYVELFVTAGGGSRVEAMRASDGAVQWSVSLGVRRHLVFADERVLVLITEPGDDPRGASAVTVLDAATGRLLWERSKVQLMGLTGGRLVVEDLSQAPEDTAERAGEAFDPSINYTPEQIERRYVALVEQTGATAWELTVPTGSVAEFTWSNREYIRLLGLAELSPQGLLRVRDLGTGGVVRSHQLDWSGTISAFSVSEAGQVVVYRAGEHGATVHDLHTGAVVFQWWGEPYVGLYACAPQRYCVGGERGIAGVDARTGTEIWRLSGYNLVIQERGNRLVLGSYLETPDQAGNLAVVDAVTGAVRRRVTGWQTATIRSGDRIIVWRPVSSRSALLGELDPVTGSVAVFGRAGDWYGTPDCVVSGGRMACVAVGELSVWRLPRRPSR